MAAVRLLVCLLYFPFVAVTGNAPPKFDEDQYVVEHLAELSPIGTPVLNVTAVDDDGDTVTYVLGGEAMSKFLINNQTGEIFVNAVLTKTEYPSSITFDVSAYDNVNGPEYKVTAAVIVLLDDINDHVPVFISEPFHADVSENANIGDIVLRVEAEDKDTSSKYGLVSYKIDAGNEEGKFAIGAYTGHITVIDTLNFDKTKYYMLNISAADRDNNEDHSTVSITILDFDNHPAVFDERTYLGSVRENAAKGFFVIQVSAHDGDSLNATVIYLLDPASDKDGKFEINNKTGVISVKGELDREQASSYLLRIGAKSTYHNPVYTTVSIQILDVNDNGPVFEQSLYEGFVPENSPVDLTVLQVTATDNDVGENSTLQYVLFGAEGKFDIRSSGHIVVKANIDREEKSQYTFVVSAQETATPDRFESNATVRINITDVNDHNPECSQDIYKATVDENRPNGTFVVQIIGVDSDADKNAEIRFTLESDIHEDADLFTIDPVSGNITTLKPLDRETENSFTLSVTLTDQAEVEQTRSGSCFIQITVGDQNDNIPKFISLLNVTTVAEDAKPGTTVVEIKAQDADVSSNAGIKYYIVSGNTDDTFHLNVSSGILTTKRELDRESIEQYNLLVNATDSGGMSQTDIVIVTVLDINDNSPKFHQPGGYHFSVDENSAALLVGIVHATDADSGLNAKIVYSLNSSATSEKFSIEPATGTIRTAVPLNRETTDHYSVTVIAEDTGSPTLSTNITVYINVSDVNDNIPSFTEKHYTATLNENEISHVFLNLSAKDEDLGINSKLHYSILSGNSGGYFTIDGETGALSTERMLDYEQNHVFTLLIQVQDLNGSTLNEREPFHDNAVVYVTVQDINDHVPVFTESYYTARLNENITIGSEVVLIRATDEDSGDNKVVEYSFHHGNELGKFFIDMNSGRVTVMDRIDRDPPHNQTSFNITVMAKDNGRPSLNSTVQLFITVDDANDNVPKFLQDEYIVYLAENSALGATLIQLQCVDIDEGRNGEFMFRIKSGVDKANPEFQVNSSTGLVTSLVSVDYDVGNHEYRLVVEAIDEGEPQLVGTTTVVIDITNINDNTPQFSQPSYAFSLNEGSYVGHHHVVGMVTAADVDDDGRGHVYGQVSYSFGNNSDVFSIDNVTGTISTNVVIDREQNTKYVLTVVAEDGDSNRARLNTSLVYINVLDENDNAPSFTKERQVIHVQEGLPKGYHIGNITAQDPDEALNGEVTYSMLSGDIAGSFLFDETTGKLKTNKELDRETDDRYDLVIQAKDKGTPVMTSLAFVTIIVDDVNDNAPVLTTTSFSSRIQENLAAGQLVCKVSATDADAGVNRDVAYSLNYPEFSVNSSGFVYTTRSLDREKIAEYDIKIVASDGGTPPKSSFVMVKVEVEDVNDNAPTFDQTLYSVLIAENMTTGSDVIQVTATDEDNGVNAELTYTLSGGHGYFNINKTTGVIWMSRQVDHEQYPGGFIVFVYASDRGIPSEQTSSVQVNIGISDVNDNPPVFELFGYEASVSEAGSPEGTVVVQVLATDKDQGLLGEVSYTITDGNTHGMFSVNNSGFILVSGILDRETQEFYELVVEATDRAGIPKAATTQVNIHVVDWNDNSPVILNAPVELEMNETTAVGTELFTILAKDEDLDKTNDKVTFHGLSDDGILAVDSETGVVTLSQTLDYSVKQSAILTIYAEDHGVPSLQSHTVNVSVTIIPKHSNTPMFEQPSYTFEVTEDTSPDNTIDRVRATQRNPAEGSRLLYEIVSGNEETWFHVNSEGTLSLLKSLDHELQSSHTITVTATNSQVSSEVGRTVVTVLVRDVNDSPPVFQYQTYLAEVLENALPNTRVVIVQAADPDYDIESELQYGISSGNDEEKFKITTVMNGEDRHVGFVFVAEALDRETMESYTIELSVTDGVFSSNCTLKIKVKDINDNDPVFEPSSYQATVPENTGAGFPVLRVTAYDNDVDENAEISYSITGLKQFSIDEISGEITTTNSSLDRETKASYSFQVVAVDIDGRKGTANVQVTISDKNDNPPSFPQPSLTTELVEGPDSQGKTFFIVQASDADLGTNQEIVYSIKTGNVGGTFEINNKTGTLTVVTAIDREMEGLGSNAEGRKMFILTIEATDKGHPPLKTSVLVNIQIDDINDNAPTFPPAGYEFMVSKDAKANMVIITVTAIDEDENENGQVVYEILEGNIGGDFIIDTNTGVLKTVNDLQRAVGFQYNLKIKGTDQGSPSLSSTTMVSMTVGEVNLHSPVFNPVNYTIEVYENNLANSVVLNVTATDEDKGQNGEISYRIISGDTGSLFTLRTEASFGELSVARLDREIQDNYVLKIMAKDGGIPTAHEAIGFITINVLDLNDNAPKFTESNYTGSLPENCGPNVLVEMDRFISASDEDIGINADVIYTVDGPGSENFIIDQTTAVLRTASSPLPILDYETNSSYTFDVVATDQTGNGLQSRVPVTIHLVDENDNTPRFVPSVLRVSVPESTAVGDVIATYAALDPDPYLNGRLRYAVISGSRGMFGIDEDDGRLRVLGELDREWTDAYRINVSAIDGNLYPRQGFGFVEVTISDVNDNPPRFSEEAEYTTTIPEDLPVGGLVLTVQASDPDLDSVVTYSLEHPVFRVDSTSGDILTKTTLDRETVGSYSITVRAEDADGMGTSVKVNVAVSDVNDNAPYFPESNQYRSDVMESVPVGSDIMLVAAMDADAGKNAELQYSLAQNVDGLFEIGSQSGMLRVKKTLNKAGLMSKSLLNNTGLMALKVQARDNGVPVLSSYQTIVLRIVTVSDTMPLFGKHFYHFNITEATNIGTIVGSVKAVPQLSSEDLVYSFSMAQNHFALNEDDGQITTTAKVNFAEQHYHVFTIQATDGDSTGYTSVGVSVLDVNDHTPVFQFNSPYTMTVREDARPGTGIGTLKATDEDWGDNARIIYTFVQVNLGPGGSMVGVDNSCIHPLGLETGVIKAISVTASSTLTTDPNRDFSATQGRLNNQPALASGIQFQGAWCAATNDGSQFLQIDLGRLKKVTRVATQGKPEDTAYVTKYSISHSLDGVTWVSHDQVLAGNIDAESVVVRKILPVFQSRYVRLHPLAWNGMICLRVELYGCDSDGGDDVTIPFIIDENTGMVNVSDELDRESQDHYVIVAEASDQGEPTRHGNTTLIIRLHDYNDNAPEFQQPSYDVTISENMFPGDVVAMVNATDRDDDSNGDVTYAIVSGDYGKFRIDDSTGVIQPSSRLDYEDPSDRHFVLNISASDHGSPVLRSYVTAVIDVTDFNDNYPEFTAPSLIGEVQENLDAGAFVAKVEASDQDSGENAVVRYSLIKASDKFSIDPVSGVVTTTQVLDREDVASYVIDVRATDTGESPLARDAKLLIKITDINDNPPIFTNKLYTRRILENSAEDTVVVTIKAEDKDAGLNGQVLYRISNGNEKGLFKLDNLTGIVSVATSLDHEVNSTTRFTVIGQDQAEPFHSDEAEIVVIVTDVNDNAPVIDPKDMVVVIPENVPTGSFVVDVNATDKDSSSNAQLEYSIVHGSSGHFAIDPHSGVVTTAVQLDYEEIPRYTVLVLVRDTGDTGYMDFGSIDITLIDTNDNAPSFVMPVGPFQVTENQGAGIEVGIVLARDADMSGNAQVKYTITGGDTENCFIIGAASGRISTTKPLDRESTPTYHLTITASNSDISPPLSTTVIATIYIQDLNDNPPSFNGTSYQGSISENSTVGKIVAQVFAQDTDEGDSAKVTFSIMDGAHSNLFHIDEQTGVITLQKSIIEMEYREFTLIVQAKDQGSPSMTSTVPVIVTVQDINDNSPLFDKRLYSASITEAAKVGDSVVQMIASDGDTQGSGVTSYQLVSGNELGHFRIDGTTGWIYVLQSLDRETVGYYELGVRAVNVVENMNRRKKRNVPFSDTVKLEINIADENDNLPVFSPLSYVGGVMPGADVGTLIVKVTATDADTGLNSQLRFNITTGNDNGHFNVADQIGSIMATEVAVGKPGTLYPCEVLARDKLGQGSPSLDHADVKIYVLFKNQQALIFSQVEPSMIKNNTDEFIRMLSNVTKSEVYVDKIYTVYKDGNVTSDVLIHAVRNLSILSDEEIISSVNLNRNLLDTVYVKWRIQTVRKYPVGDGDDEDGLLGWEIALIVIGVIIFIILILLCCFWFFFRRWKRNYDEEIAQSPRKNVFTNSPVTRQREESLSDTQQFYSSSHGPLPFSLSQNITNPIYCADLDDESDGYEEKEMELSLSDEEPDQYPSHSGATKKKSLRK